MAKAIGPTFGDELKSAGLLGLPFSWSPEGAFNLSDKRLSAMQKTAIQAVYAAHDPTKTKPPEPSVADRLVALESAVDAVDSKVTVVDAKVDIVVAEQADIKATVEVNAADIEELKKKP